ncbi:aminotransferase class I/II-fold pyridoxal phosphate-dependent enzyme [Metabacillus sp. Hm71]|uniref:aminotransferase class I/II-fold pyridoxal phosphate-dependent enzyme n=1 Tax=Metabacillus sp. Hm71 TaxID=3450743 RepID=UPI003F42CCE2
METPLFTALMQHSKRNPMSFHVPGHKNGTVFMGKAKQVYKGILPFDVTELTGLDDLHHPKEAIAHAQELTASLYGVENTYFLVNGTTVGNLAMVLACCRENDIVLVQRNSHKSILNGIQLAGANPVFLSPKVDEVYQVPSYIEMETIKEAIACYPTAKALVLTNPNYYGLAIDLTEIIRYAHERSIPVLVDEAHGSHFITGDQFPLSAVHAGADIVVHSAHKTLPAMTMGSYLHFNSKMVDKDKLVYYLSILQSSSPSYPIMASLDLARAYLEMIKKEDRQHDILQVIADFREEINSINNIKIVTSKDQLVQTDPLKLTIRAANGLTGFELQDFLETKQIYTELADPANVLFILPLAYDKLIIKELDTIKRRFPTPSHPIKQLVHMSNRQSKRIQPIEKSYSDLKTCKKRVVAFGEAIGHYAAEAIIPYPPGIPFIMIGETITNDLIEQVKELIEIGATIQGDDHIQQGKIAVYMKGS